MPYLDERVFGLASSVVLALSRDILSLVILSVLTISRIDGLRALRRKAHHPSPES